MVKISKRNQKNYEHIDSKKAYSLETAVKLLKGIPQTAFDQTVEIAMNLNIDPRKADQQVRGAVSLPHGTGQSLRVAVFAKGEKLEEAKAAGADVVGGEDLAEIVAKGTMDFDRCISTPDMMGVVGKLGKVLGPRGMMPNPKLGTVTMDVKSAVAAIKKGQAEFRAEKAGVVHAPIGKLSFDESALLENLKFFIDTVIKAKPSGAKGHYLTSISISSTMGPGIRVSL